MNNQLPEPKMNRYVFWMLVVWCSSMAGFLLWFISEFSKHNKGI